MTLPLIVTERRRLSSGQFALAFAAAVGVLTCLTAVAALLWQRAYERDWGMATMQTLTVVHGQDGEGSSCTVNVRVPGLKATRTAEGAPCGLRKGTGVGAWVSPHGRVFFRPPPTPTLRSAHVITAVALATVVAAFGWTVLLALGVWAWHRWQLREPHHAWHS